MKNSNNSIHSLRVYKWHNSWVFDDLSRGLIKEPFVEGADHIFEFVIQHAGPHFGVSPEARFEQGAYVDTLFSASAFPNHDICIEKVSNQGQEERDFEDGTDYAVKHCTYDSSLVGWALWLCPALFKYYPFPGPDKIYMKAAGIGTGYTPELPDSLLEQSRMMNNQEPMQAGVEVLTQFVRIMDGARNGEVFSSMPTEKTWKSLCELYRKGSQNELWNVLKAFR
jgi:hypothetical protein